LDGDKKIHGNYIEFVHYSKKKLFIQL